jgi:hypothetical protein
VSVNGTHPDQELDDSKAYSLEVRDPFSLVKVGGVVNLEFLVDWGHLGLNCVFVLSIDESESGILAGIR